MMNMPVAALCEVDPVTHPVTLRVVIAMIDMFRDHELGGFLRQSLIAISLILSTE